MTQKREFEDCMLKLFSEIALKAFNKEDIDLTPECANKEIPKEMVEEAVKEEITRQINFYKALENLKQKFNKHNLDMKILPPNKVYQSPYWDFGLIHGCNLQINNAYLYAVPLVPAGTTNYMALRQEPVAAYVVYIDNDMMVFLPHNQDIDEKTSQEFKDIFKEPKDLKLKNAFIARQGNNFIEISADNINLAEIKKEYNPIAVIEAHGSIAKIHINKEVPKLLTLILKWHEQEYR